MEHPSEQTLNAYVDHVLDHQQEKDVEAHLTRCSQCSREVEELTRLFDELKALPSPDRSRRLTNRILVAQQKESRGNLISFDIFTYLFGRLGWVAVAAGLLAGILLGQSAKNTWMSVSPPTKTPYAINDQTDLSLDFLISDNGEIF